MFVHGIYDNQLQQLLSVADTVDVSGKKLSDVILDDIKDINNEMWRLYLAQWDFLVILKYLISKHEKGKISLSEVVIKKYDKLVKNIVKKFAFDASPETLLSGIPSHNYIREEISRFKHFEDFAETHNVSEMFGVNLWEYPIWENTKCVLPTIERKVINLIKDKIPFKSLDQYDVILSYDDGMVWVDLNTNKCSIEARATGHCGTATYDDSTLLSLRKIHSQRGQNYFTVAVTIELRENGDVVQIKGTKRGGESNVPIAPEYKPYVLDLLVNYEPITNIRQGSMYNAVTNQEFAPVFETIDDLYYLIEKRPDFNFSGIYSYFNATNKFPSEEVKKKVTDLIISKMKDSIDEEQLDIILSEVSADVSNIFNAPEEEFTKEVVEEVIDKYMPDIFSIVNLGQRYYETPHVTVRVDICPYVDIDKVREGILAVYSEDVLKKFLYYKEYGLDDLVRYEYDGRLEYLWEDAEFIISNESNYDLSLEAEEANRCAIDVGYSVDEIYNILIDNDKINQYVADYINKHKDEIIILFLNASLEGDQSFYENISDLIINDINYLDNVLKIVSWDEKLKEDLLKLVGLKSEYSDEAFTEYIIWRITEDDIPNVEGELKDISMEEVREYNEYQ